MALSVLNPATGREVRRFEEMSAHDCELALERARHAFDGWRETPVDERAAHLKTTARILRAREKEYARLMAEEMGKPVKGGVAEIGKCAWACEYFAVNGKRFLEGETVRTDEGAGWVRPEPLGPLLAIEPWNFPFWQVFRFAAPALLAGNVALLKHASNVQGCARAIEELLLEAGLPRGVFQVLRVRPDALPRLIGDPRVKGVALTGGDQAGEAVGAEAGRHLKKTVLELGGSDAFVVLEDADVPAAARTAAVARTVNSGQSCIAAKRLIAVGSTYEEFLHAFIEEMAKLKVGDPLDPHTDVGPLAREDVLQDVLSQVDRSLVQGAHVELGGKRLDRPGFFMAPTVLTHVRRGMPVWDEEVFGPVAPVVRAESEAEAISLANDSPYGLGASVWTANVERGKGVAAKLEVGMVHINSIVHSDPRFPFGGLKRSGHGRELARQGMLEFTNVKVIRSPNR